MTMIYGGLDKDAGSVGETREALGYYVTGDGGGGSFRWDASSTLPSDGGTIIEPDEVQGGPGRWLRSFTVGLVDVRWFGAHASAGWPGATGYTGPTRGNKQAFEAAIRCLTPTPVPSYHGPRVAVPPGRYDFADTLIVDRAAALVGVGWDGLAASWLVFPAGKDGVRIFRDLPPSTPGLQPPLYQRPRGDYSALESLRITGGLGQGGHGVHVNATCRIDRCYIQGFQGNGVHVDCSVPATNANAWRFTDVRVNDCHHGFFFDGSDSNAGQGIGLNATSCRGWGILDESFLGNYFFGCHFASCHGPMRTTNANARSVFVGCYSEGDQVLPEVAAPSLIIGGIIGGNNSTGGYIGEGEGAMRVRRGEAHIVNDRDGHGVKATIGSSNLPRTAFEIASGESPPYRIRHGLDTPPGWASRAGWWALEYAGVTAGTAIRWCDDTAAEWLKAKPGAKAGFDQGFYVGGAFRVFTGAATAPPTSGTWARGDRLLNTAPSPGGWAGWICTAASSTQNPAGVWKGFGAIAL